MTHKPPYMDWGFWFQWVLATSVGWALAGVVKNILHNDPGTVPDMLFLALSGIPIGVIQWLILQRRLPHSSWWVLTAFFGSIAELIFNVVQSTQGSDALWGTPSFIKVFVIGASVGIAQWYGLRTQHISSAGWWILASLAAYFAMFVVSSVFVISSVHGYWVEATLQGSVVGAITGIALIWLLRKPLSHIELEQGNSDLTTPWALSAIFGAMAGFIVSLLPVGIPMFFVIVSFFYDCGYSTKCPPNYLLSGYILIGFVCSALIGGLIGGWRRYHSKQTDRDIFRGGRSGAIIGEALFALAYTLALSLSR